MCCVVIDCRCSCLLMMSEERDIAGVETLWVGLMLFVGPTRTKAHGLPSYEAYVYRIFTYVSYDEIHDSLPNTNEGKKDSNESNLARLYEKRSFSRAYCFFVSTNMMWARGHPVPKDGHHGSWSMHCFRMTFELANQKWFSWRISMLYAHISKRNISSRHRDIPMLAKNKWKEGERRRVGPIFSLVLLVLCVMIAL